MSELTKQALKVENSQSFPNNNDGLITPSNLRTFNENIIDSLVDEIGYNEDSASWNNSIDSLNQFTSSQQPSFTALNAFTQSQLGINSGYNNATQSLQGQITTLVNEVDTLQAFTSSVNEISDDGIVQGFSTRLHFYGNVSASIVQNVNGPIASIEIPFSATDTGSLLTTASFNNNTRNLTFTKGDSSQFSVNIPDVSGSTINTGSFATTGSNVFIGNQTITGSLLISGSEVVTGPLTASRLQINGITDLNGVLDVSNDATFRGDVLIQSSGEQKFKMRSTSGGGVSQGFDLLIQTASFIIRDETHDIDFLEFDYISSSADHILKLEANRFEMNSGSLGISGSLTASLQEGYVWVGGAGNVSTIVPTSSFGGGGTIDTGSFATTGSNSFNGSQIVTGSLTILNDITITGATSKLELLGIASQIKANNLTGSWGQTNDINGNALKLNGSLSVSETIKSQVYINPQTLNGFTIPTGNNAMLVGPVAISGSVVVEGNSNLLILSQITSSGATPLPSGVVSGSSQLTSSYDLRYTLSGSVQPLPSGVVSGSSQIDYPQISNIPADIVSGSSQLTASYDLRYALSGSGGGTIPTGSFATTGSNTFIGDQFITGGLFLSSSDAIIFNVPNFPGAPAPGGLSVTGSMSVNGNFAVIGGGFTVGQVNTPKIVGTNGGRLDIVSNVLIFNDGDINNSKNLGVSGSVFVSQSISVGGDLFVGGNKQFNVGTFDSTTTQSGSANVSQSLQFNNTEISQGVTLVSGSRLTLVNSGTYNIQLSIPDFQTDDVGPQVLNVFLHKNGTIVSNTTRQAHTNGANVSVSLYCNWVVNAASNDYYELVMQTTDSDLRIINTPASGSVAQSPAIIATVTQVR
jgi:hypothetical protein